MRAPWSHRPGKLLAFFRGLGALFIIACGVAGQGGTGWFCIGVGVGLLGWTWWGLRRGIVVADDGAILIRDGRRMQRIEAAAVREFTLSLEPDGSRTRLFLADGTSVELPIRSRRALRKCAEAVGRVRGDEVLIDERDADRFRIRSGEGPREIPSPGASGGMPPIG